MMHTSAMDDLPLERNRLALFYLRAMNDAAIAVTRDERNRHLVYKYGDELVIDIGHVLSRSASEPVGLIATLGHQGDVYLPEDVAWAVQCSFRVGPAGDSIILFNDSESCGTICHQDGIGKFWCSNSELGIDRSGQGFDSIFITGRDINTALSFSIGCYYQGDELNSELQRWVFRHQRPARPATVKEIPNAEPTKLIMSTFGATEASLESISDIKGLKYECIGEALGCGSYGQVYKARDVKTNRVFAVKQLFKNPKRINPEELAQAKNEVKIHMEMNHPHITQCFGSRGWDSYKVEIFLELKSGSLESLIENIVPGEQVGMIEIMHRDLKPENILHSIKDGNYVFQLTDFGLSKNGEVGKTRVGTPLFWAPEMFRHQVSSTSKADIWSLYVTLLWAINLRKCRDVSYSIRSYPEWHDLVLKITRLAWATLGPIQAMAVVDPRKRATAAQMLVFVHNGEGLSSKRCDIPPLQKPEPPGPATRPVARLQLPVLRPVFGLATNDRRQMREPEAVLHRVAQIYPGHDGQGREVKSGAAGR